MNEYLIAAILGVVEGLTEYLPVSSTGHLILFGELLKFSDERAKIFDIVIQLGAILAVVVLYWDRFKRMLTFKGEPMGEGIDGLAGVTKLVLTTMPAVVAALLFQKTIKEHLFSPFPVAVALGVGGILMLLIERRNNSLKGRDVSSLTNRQSFLIGCAQCFALWPGVSRSACTLIAGMMFGLSRTAAAEFSFLAAVPILTAAALHDMIKGIAFFSMHDLLLVLIGFLLSFVTALFAVKTFIVIVQRWSLAPFAIYRLVLAAVVILWFV